MEKQESETPTQIIYRRVGKDIDSNKWWWATCSSVNEAENLVNLLNGYEKKLAASKAEVERLRSQLQRAVEIAENVASHVGWPVTEVSELMIELKALKKEIK